LCPAVFEHARDRAAREHRFQDAEHRRLAAFVVDDEHPRHNWQRVGSGNRTNVTRAAGLR